MFTHYSAQEHGLWRIKSGILHQSDLFHYGLHVIHLRAEENALLVTKSNMKHQTTLAACGGRGPGF